MKRKGNVDCLAALHSSFMQKQRLYVKYISILYRLTNRFYDHQLAPYQIGCGQQFFLLRIHENEGISMYELASLGRFDKGTVTKGIQKLEEQAYVRMEMDPDDKRVRRLYTTDKAKDAIAALYRSRQSWVDSITEGLTPEEKEQAEHLLQRMAENAYAHTCAGCASCCSDHSDSKNKSSNQSKKQKRSEVYVKKQKSVNK